MTSQRSVSTEVPARPAVRWQVHVLGTVGVLLDGVCLDLRLARRTPVRRLLQVICRDRHARATRVELISALWPHLDDRHGRNRLSHTVHLLRKALAAAAGAAGATLLEATPDAISLHREVEIDVVHLESLLAQTGCADQRRTALRSALLLYRGDLAHDWPDACPLASRRQELRGRLLAALDEVANLEADCGAVDEALALRLKRIDLAPMDDDGHARYVDALVAAGLHDAALAHCQSALRQREAAGDPVATAALARLLQRIRSDAALPPPALTGVRCAQPACLRVPPPSETLVGRETLLDRICAEVMAPHGALLTLFGPPGAGKTALAHAAAARMQGTMRDGAVMMACHTLPGADALATALGQAVAPLRPDTGVAAASVADVLRQAEVLLVLDSVRSDEALAAWIAQLATSAPGSRIMCTADQRLRVRGERAIEVEFLSDAGAAASLLGRSLRIGLHDTATPERQQLHLLRIAALLEGWPLALRVARRRLAWMSPVEVIERLERGELSESTDCGESVLRDALLRWTDHPAIERSLLLWCAVFEGRFTRSDLAQLAQGQGRERLDVFLVESVGRRLLLRYTRCTTLGDISEYRLPTPLRQWLRRSIEPADWKARLDRHEDWLRHRLQERSGASLDPACLGEDIDTYHQDIRAALERAEAPALLDFARALLPGLPHARNLPAATGWIDLALTHAPDESAARADLLLGRAGLYLRANDRAQARTDLEAALATLSKGDDAALYRQALELLHQLDSDNPAVAIASHRPISSVIARAALETEHLLRVAFIAAGAGEFEQGGALARRALEIADFVRDDANRARAMRLAGRICFAQGDIQRAADWVRHARRVAENRRLAGDAARATLILAEVALAEGDVTEAIGDARRVLESHAELLPVQMRAQRVLAWARYRTADLRGAKRHLLRLAHQSRHLADAAHQANALLLDALLHAEVDDLSASRAAAAELSSRLACSYRSLDPQFELVEFAYLAARLQRGDVAAGLLGTLGYFCHRPGRRLRGDIAIRARSVEDLARLGPDRSAQVLAAVDALQMLAAPG